MEYLLKAGAAEKQSTGCLVLAVFSGGQLSDTAAAVDAASEGAIQAVIDSGDLRGKLGESLLLHSLKGVAAERVLLVGCGSKESISEGDYRKALSVAATAVVKTAAEDALNCLTLLSVGDRNTAWNVQQAVIACASAWYRFDEVRNKKTPERKLKCMEFAVAQRDDAADTALAQGVATAQGMALTQDLGNRPGNLCTPSDLAEQAQDMAEQYDAINCKVLEEADMEKLGMGALLSVSRGSRQPAKLIIMEYLQGPKGEAPISLVGKGLTFDAGGISLKPAAKMEEMKFDMCGGATVFGVMKALAEMKLPLNIVALVPASENLPDGDANKPGDVVTSMAGISIEVINTDAEGRLILCDALTYAQQEYQPKTLIDMATLTGACVVALGSQATGLLSNDQSLADELLDAGQETGDRAWQMPLWEEYQQQLKSAVADVANVGGPGAGTITAACFLHRFTRDARWAHLDIAGTAWSNKKLATGRPVHMLMQYLINESAK